MLNLERVSLAPSAVQLLYATDPERALELARQRAHRLRCAAVARALRWLWKGPTQRTAPQRTGTLRPSHG